MRIYPLHPFLSVAILCTLFAVPAFAQSFPSRIVRIIVPSPAGSTVDLAARPLARELSAIWSQPVLMRTFPAGTTPSLRPGPLPPYLTVTPCS